MSSIWERTYSHGSMTSKALSLLPSYRVFRKTYKFLKKSQWWSKEQLEEYQLQQLSKLLNHAYENVPYYTKVFDDLGLKPEDIQDINDLQKLPFLTKDIIRENSGDLKARNYSKDQFEHVVTSGTTAPLGFYYEKGVSRAREWAFIKTQWDRVGYRFTDKSVVLRGYTIESGDESKFWEYSLFRRWLILSAFHMSEENLPKYVEKIRRFKPKFIQAYPSTITILARFMKENDVEPFRSVKALLCSSENLYSWQRKLLEDVFHCRVYSWYGHAEQAVLAGECEVSYNYHIFSEYGIVEFIDKSGRVITNDGKVGEIVATSLNNYVMPFIRYRTKDLAQIRNSSCECNRNYPMIQRIEGRLQEVVVTKDKKLISLTTLLSVLEHLEAQFMLKAIQLVQKKEGEVIIKIIKAIGYSDKDENEILTKMQKAVGDRLDIKLEYVYHIPYTKSGKHKFLIQKLPIELMEYNRDLCERINYADYER